MYRACSGTAAAGSIPYKAPSPFHAEAGAFGNPLRHHRKNVSHLHPCVSHLHLPDKLSPTPYRVQRRLGVPAGVLLTQHVLSKNKPVQQNRLEIEQAKRRLPVFSMFVARAIWIATLLFLSVPLSLHSQIAATAKQDAKWRTQIRQALFIPTILPAVAPQSFDSFFPAPGVIAERVTYATLYGMRVPAIVYRPASTKPGQKLPGIVVVNGHSGDKTSWYSFYTGVLYATAGAVVITYDPVDEDERDANRASDSRAHDTVIPGEEMPRRMGGQMVTDILQSTAYLAQRSDVDSARIAVLAYSMGSFHAAIAGAIDPHLHALILSGGGNLDGVDGYWESSSKIMCQAGPYKALRSLGDRGAVLYALNASRGATLVMNGTADNLITSKNTGKGFFDDLHRRTERISGSQNLFEQVWFPEAGHRPSFVTRPAALFLERQLHLPNWNEASIRSLPEIMVRSWSEKTGARVGPAWQKESSEWGVPALDINVPNIPRDQLQAVPFALWEGHRDEYTWSSWAIRAQKVATHSAVP